MFPALKTTPIMSKDARLIPRLCYDDKFVDFVDEEWTQESLPDEEVVLPIEHQPPAPEDFPGVLFSYHVYNGKQDSMAQFQNKTLFQWFRKTDGQT